MSFCYFLDSNVLIAYVFCFDPWHINSNNVFDTKCLYYSPKVKKETDKVLNTKISLTYEFLNKLSFEFEYNFNTFNNFADFNNFVLNLEFSKDYFDELNIKLINEILWFKIFKLDNYIDSFSLFKILNDFNLNFMGVLKKRKDRMFENLTFCNSHTQKLIIKNIEKHIHFSDLSILYDANELASNIDSNLYFITGDFKFYEGIKYFEEYFFFKDIKYLGEFVS